MSWWNAKYKNDHGEYEITFGSRDYEKTKVVEKVCQAIIDKRINTDNAADFVELILKAGSCEGCIYSHRKRPQKCSCCRRNRDLKDCYERREENAAD